MIFKDSQVITVATHF